MTPRLRELALAMRAAGGLVMATQFTLVPGRGGEPLIADHLKSLRPFLRKGDFAPGSFDQQVIEALQPGPGVFLDGTLGAGGYTRAMLDAGAETVIAIDRDPEALARAGDACEAGDPAQGTREAAGIMRLIGHIEARLGLAPPNLSPQRLGGIAPAPRG